MRTTTTNGAGAFQHTGNKLVDLFFNIGASRNNLEGIRKDFKAACTTNKLKAIAILLWARDIRHNGAGERQVFRTLLTDLLSTRNSFGGKVVSLIPEIGRFDDLKVAYGTFYENQAAKIWSSAIKEKNVLAAKWADRKDRVLQSALMLNEAGLRKLLSSIRKEHLVESKMCAKQFNLIDYDKIPSVAGMRYAKAFRRNDGIRYQAFIDSDTTTVNAKAAFPYDVYRMFASGKCSDTEVQKYWDNLPDLMLSGSVLPMIDTSGSMTWFKVAGNLCPLQIAISLGAYCSQKIDGPFNGNVMTFAAEPSFIDIKHQSAVNAFRKIEHMSVGGNTNIQAAYRLILDKAKKVNAEAKDIPKFIMIISDMQFDAACPSAITKYDYEARKYVVTKGLNPETIHENMTREFKAAGYELPKVIYWNMNAMGGFPTANFEKNVALVSGFSPNILKAVLKADSAILTPESVMEEAISPFVEMLNSAV